MYPVTDHNSESADFADFAYVCSAMPFFVATSFHIGVSIGSPKSERAKGITPMWS